MTMPDWQSPLSSTGPASVRMHLLKPLLSGVLSEHWSAETLPPPLPEPLEPPPLSLEPLMISGMATAATTRTPTTPTMTHSIVFLLDAGGGCGPYCGCGAMTAAAGRGGPAGTGIGPLCGNGCGGGCCGMGWLGNGTEGGGGAAAKPAVRGAGAIACVRCT